MTPDRLKKIEEIYHAVLEISPDQRKPFLQLHCGDDAELYDEVSSLLSFDKTFDSVIDSSPKSLVNSIFPAESHFAILHKTINQYEIVSLLGEGGMGAVFLARDTKLERKVAIKFLSDTLQKDSNRLNRFFREAKAASALNHPNIITVYEIGEFENKPFIATEFIDGTTLNHYSVHEKLTVGGALDIAAQIASALASAHSAGIIHRDVKPDNVMIRKDGIVKVLDFGLAKLTQETGSVDSEGATQLKKLTIDGMIMGTPQYMSPEQARGQKVDLRTDIFSFGVMLYEMLAGNPPFQGDSAVDTIGSILKDSPKSLREIVPELPEEIERIVNKSLRKDRDQRYQHISDLLVDLNDVRKSIESHATPLQNTAIINSPKTRGDQTRSIATAPRFSLVHILAIISLCILLFGGIWWFAFRGLNNQANTILKTQEIVNWTSSPGEGYSVGTFSPDGKMIAFTSTKIGSKNIWLKQTASGEAVQITKDEFKNENPIWSPNGEEIAFFSTKGGEAGFWRIPALGGSAKLILTIDDGSSRLRVWSKTNQIYFESKNELFAIDVNSNQKKQITNLVSKGIKGTSLNLSLDEKNVAYATVEGEITTLWLNNLTGETPKKLLDSKTDIKNIAWHPDNNRIFYSASVDGVFQVFVTDISGTLPRQISTNEQDSLVLDISADGSKILYGSAKEESDVWGVNIKEAKEFTVASDIDSELWADVSPDGKTLAYQSIKSLSQGNKLFSGNILTKTIGEQEQPQELVKNGGLPKWSPDGKTLAFVKIEGDKYQIRTIKTIGGEDKQITTDGISSINNSVLPYNRVQTSDFSWSPDGNKLAYLSVESGSPRDIWITNANGSHETNLTENNDKNLSLSCPLWSSDGKKIAFTTKTGNAEGKPAYSLQIIDAETKQNDTILDQNTFNRLEITFIRLIGWSQTGNELLLASIKDNIVGLPPEVSLISVEIASGKVREIVKLKDTYLYNIHLSPDKKTIAFAAHREAKDNVWIISANGGEAKKVTNNNDSRLYFSSLAWSPDSNSIFFGKQLRYSLLSMLTNFK
jgi:eukaryotic-like serine/threonine-protein kinase